MSLTISGGSFIRRNVLLDGAGAINVQEPEPSPDDESQQVVVDTADIQAQLVAVEEEGASAAAQFGRLRVSERKGRRSDELERILDTDAEEKLEDLGALMGRLGGDRNIDQIDFATLLREAGARFRDASDLLLALRELRRRRRIAGQKVDVIEQAIEEVLVTGDAKLIKAGINSALKAKVFGARLQLDPRRLRELYRQFLQFEGSYLVVYEDWIAQFGAHRRKRILDYVSGALTYDMQSLDPSSRCPVEFGPLLGTLHHVRMLSSTDEFLVARFVDNALARNCGVTEERALTMLLGGLLTPFSVADVLNRAIGDLLKSMTAECRSQMLQLALRAFLNVPVSLYPDPTARRAVIDVLEDLMGLAYAREMRLTRARASR